MGRRCASSPMRIGLRRLARSIRPISMTERSSTSRARQSGWELPGFDTSGWKKAAVIPYQKALIRPRQSAAVREIETRPTQVISRSGNKTILDGGQNLAGFVRLTVKGDQGDQVTVRHAEVLESDGELHTRALRSAKATDTYTLADGGEVDLEPTFTFHGFRYAEVETKAEVISAEFVAISSDLPRRGSFECSDQTLNRLHENVVWSQQANFVSIPTDCPQRDERLGWTGDAQAFAPTACTLFEAQQFWSSWLEDLALDQDDVLGVPSVVPDVVLDGDPRFGRAGWADAATIVPWAVYESYGDLEILRRQFDSMRRWVESLERRREAGGLLPPSMQFGDWLDPDAPPERPWEAKADSTFLANAFFAHSARLAAEAAEASGRIPGAQGTRYRLLADELAALTWDRWRDHIVETQTGCAVALSFGVVPDAERRRHPQKLADLVRLSEGKVATGFLGTPLVLHALAAGGHFDEAYQMLLRRRHPSWLYQVEMGATIDLGAVGCHPARRLDPSRRHGAAARHGGSGRSTGAHAQLQSLCLRGCDRLGVSTSRRSGSRSQPTGLSTRDPRSETGRGHRLGPSLDRFRFRDDSHLMADRTGWSPRGGCADPLGASGTFLTSSQQ